MKSKKFMIVVGVVIPAFAIALFIYLTLPVSVFDSRLISIDIPSGSSLSDIARILKDAGVVKSRYFFMSYVYAGGGSSDLKAGRYLLSPSYSLVKIARVLVGGLSEPDDIEVLIPEGSNIWEIENNLVKEGLIKVGQFSQLYFNKEGHLFPDTYRLDKDLKNNGQELSNNLVSKMESNFQDKVGMISDEALIIASLLEKEAKTDEDMRLVAGIIKKRLEKGMALQIDASVAYGACLRISQQNMFARTCDVTQIGIAGELKIDSPYNTYTRVGLPAGPISNPGLKAIEAALDPKASDYLYYLSTSDGSQIIYAKTAAEHLSNRRKYLGL